MNSNFDGYAVFFFPQALEALGEAIKPYLLDSPAGPHVLCREIDAGGPLIELTMEGKTSTGQPLDLELMLPTSMVRMIVSARGDQAFGFGPRTAVEPLPAVTPVVEDAPGPAHAPAADSGTGPRRRRSPAQRAADQAGAARKRPAPAKPAKTVRTAKGKQPNSKTARRQAGKTAARKPVKETR